MSDTPTLLAMGDADQVGGMAHTAVCAVITQAGDSFELPLLSGSLSFDETRTPRAQMDLTTHLLTDQALMTRIDPRGDCRVKLAVGYIRPDGLVDVQQIADLGLRSRSRNRPDDTMDLSATGDEDLILDNTVSTSLSVSASTTAQGIADIIHIILPSATVTIDVASPGPAVSIPSTPDMEKWQTMMDLADRLGGVAVYDDGMRHWYISDRPNVCASANLVLSDGPTGTLVSITEDNSREGTAQDGWYNRVKMLYKWTDSSDVDHRVAVVCNATGPFAPTTSNTRTWQEDRSVPTTTTDATTVGNTLVARTVTRGRTYTVSAPSTYWVRPGNTVTIREDGRDDEDHMVQKVSFDLSSGLMTLTTRQPA